MKRLILAAVLLTTMSGVLAEGYLCVADQATGFSFDKKAREWRQTNIHSKGNRFVIRPPTPAEAKIAKDTLTNRRDPGFVVIKVGDKRPNHYCGDFSSAGIMFCDGYGENFVFSKERLRFSHSSAWLDYLYSVGPDPIGTGSPFEEEERDVILEIGTCSPM